MIISHTHNFIFFHNPKAGGTSVRATIERFSDTPFGFWGIDIGQTGERVDRAHLGIDEFARYYPKLWEQTKRYDMFCLFRDPLKRFYSSLAEYSKLHGDVDTRFASTRARKNALMSAVKDLDAYGTSDAILDVYELRHFRPQWIYSFSKTPGVRVNTIPVEKMKNLFDAISRKTGQALVPQTRNQQQKLDIPGPLGRIAGNRKMKSLMRAFPGKSIVKTLLQKKFVPSSDRVEDFFDLSPSEVKEIARFVRNFYAKDYSLRPELARSSVIDKRAVNISPTPSLANMPVNS